jgi:surface protein
MNIHASITATDRAHLEALMAQAIAFQGLQCSLNHIDVSGIKDFCALFTEWQQFNGDISQWNTSSAVSMCAMFKDCEFNGDISQWDTSKVTDMDYMFKGAKFNGDISKWNVGNVQILNSMFAHSQFNGDISAWNVSRVVEMKHMFEGTLFNQDISKWDVSMVHRMDSLFSNSRFNGDISKWSVENVKQFSNMFADGVFAHDISAWTLHKEATMPSFYNGNALFLAAQTMTPWIVGLHLQNEEIPKSPEWARAFSNIQSLALSLELSHTEHIAAILEAHRFIVESTNPVDNDERFQMIEALGYNDGLGGHRTTF